MKFAFFTLSLLITGIASGQTLNLGNRYQEGCSNIYGLESDLTPSISPSLMEVLPPTIPTGTTPVRLLSDPSSITTTYNENLLRDVRRVVASDNLNKITAGVYSTRPSSTSCKSLNNWRWNSTTGKIEFISSDEEFSGFTWFKGLDEKVGGDFFEGPTAEEVACTFVKPGGDFASILEGIDSSKCFKIRKKNDADRLKEKELLTKDLESCNCLRTSVFKPVTDTMSAEAFNKPFSQPRNKQTDRMRAQFDTMARSLMVNALAITKENEKGPVIEFTKIFPGKKEDYPQPELQPILGSMLQTQDVLRERDAVPGQCISSVDTVLSNLIMDPQYQNIKNYSPEDWDYEKLMTEYRNGFNTNGSPKNRQRHEELKAKIVFLHRNPMYRFTLNASEEDARRLNISKVELLASISGLQSKGCVEPILNRLECIGKFKALQESLFKAPEMAKFITDRARESLIEEARRPAKAVTQKNLIGQFHKLYPSLISPNECFDKGPSEECIMSFAGYCKVLDHNKSEIDQLNNLIKPTENIEAILEDSFNTDYASNEDLKKVNEAFCTRKIGTRRVTFDQFKRDHCQKTSSPGCQSNNPKDWGELREIFKAETKPLNVADDAYIAQAVHADRTGQALANDNVRSSVSQQPFVGALASGTAAVSSGGGLAESQAYKERKKRFYNFGSGSVDDYSLPAGTGNSSKLAASTTGSGSGSASTPKESPQDKSQAQNFLQDNGIGFQPSVFNPSTPAFVPSTLDAPSVAQPQRIEEMNDQKRAEFLSDLKEDMNELNQKSATDPEAKAKVASMQAQIDALKDLLESQKQLTREQTQMLNRSLAERAEKESPEAPADQPSNERIRSTQNIASVNPSEVLRAPASVIAAPRAASVIAPQASLGGGSVGSARTTAGGTGNKAVADTSAVQREEGKRLSAASLTVSSNGGSVTQAGGRSISLEINESQYRDPNRYLSEIERMIPKEQLENLQDNSQVVLLLKNGENPPVQVIVEKKNNKLVAVVANPQRESGRAPASVRNASLDALNAELLDAKR